MRMTRASAIGLAEAPSPRWRSSAAARAGTMRATSDVAQTIVRARARLRAVTAVFAPRAVLDRLAVGASTVLWSATAGHDSA